MFQDTQMIAKLEAQEKTIAAQCELARELFLKVKYQRGHDSFVQAQKRWESLSDSLASIREQLEALKSN